MHLVIDDNKIELRLPEEAVNPAYLIGQTIAINGKELKVSGVRVTEEFPSHFTVDAREPKRRLTCNGNPKEK